MNPKVSVIIPTYNRANLLSRAINSVLSQTFQDFEIIVFDNFSNYNVEEFLKEFNDNRITLLRSDKNVGNVENLLRYSHINFLQNIW